MEIYFLPACITLGLAAACVAGFMAKQNMKAKDNERRRRTVHNLRVALGD